MSIQNVRNRKPITDKRVLGLIQSCIQCCKELGYEVPNNLKFKKCKATQRAGLACYGDCTIVLSDFLWKESDKSIQEIIYHEIAHIIAGKGVHHGPAWQKIVNKINKANNMNISRLWGKENLPVHYAEIHSLNYSGYKYSFRCTTCGQIIRFHRATKFTKSYDQYLGDHRPRWTCARCGGIFEKIK